MEFEREREREREREKMECLDFFSAFKYMIGL